MMKILICNYILIFPLLLLTNFSYSFRIFGLTNLKVISNKIVLNSNNNDDIILKKIDKWACIKNCGACCKLGPLDSRPDLDSYLSKDELVLYKSMIGPDDWCINYDQSNKLCKIYNDRPNFCRVDVKNFKKMFGIEEEEFNDFCTFCCSESIADVYGEDSDVMDRFEEIIDSLNDIE